MMRTARCATRPGSAGAAATCCLCAGASATRYPRGSGPGTRSRGAQRAPQGAQGAPEADREAAAARIKRAHSLHDPSVAIGGTPGERYLERRGVRVHGVSDVRWLDAAVAPPGPVRGWAGLPGAAAGAVVYVWRTLDSRLSAISLEAVDGLGRRLDEFGVERFRRTVGVRAGALFVPLEARAGAATQFAEGEVSALRAASAPCKVVLYALGTDPADAPSPPPRGGSR